VSAGPGASIEVIEVRSSDTFNVPFVGRDGMFTRRAANSMNIRIYQSADEKKGERTLLTM
ncbi:MAG: hypothetical protein O2955_21985, partial [Planctomycetota bacterium]|nr:hypothetical protein [Planctomycetota bacterium]